MRIEILFKKFPYYFRFLFFGELIVFFILLSSSAYAAIPKSGNIAVVVAAMSRSDATPYQTASAESLIVKGLIAKGYKPVDEEILARVRDAGILKAAADDNVEAVRRISSQYGISTTIAVWLKVSMQEDYLVGYVGRVSMVIVVTHSDGKRLYSNTIEDRVIVHKSEDAVPKAMESAIKKAINDMT